MGGRRNVKSPNDEKDPKEKADEKLCNPKKHKKETDEREDCTRGNRVLHSMRREKEHEVGNDEPREENARDAWM